MSEFTCPVVRLGVIQKHPNADTLSTTTVEGETVVVRTGDFNEGDLAVYVPVDAVVPETVPGTEFLKDKRRIRAMRLRGIYSEGLILPVDVLKRSGSKVEGGVRVGVDLASVLGIKKHEDVVPASLGGSGGKGGSLGGGEQASPPSNVPAYDIENGKKYHHHFIEGEPVVITEKLHGTNARYAWVGENGGLCVGSRNLFWKDPRRPHTWQEKASAFLHKLNRRWGRPLRASKDNVYWRVARDLGLADALQRYPKLAFYGEIFGDVQDLKYAHPQGQVSFRVFDIYDRDSKRWLDWSSVVAVCGFIGLNTVPVLWVGPYSKEKVESLVEGTTAIGAHMREGVVVKPVATRDAPHFGRLILKWVSQSYKLRRGGTELH